MRFQKKRNRPHRKPMFSGAAREKMENELVLQVAKARANGEHDKAAKLIDAHNIMNHPY